jgi:hypothetical protein
MILLIVIGSLFGGCILLGAIGSASNRNREPTTTTPSPKATTIPTTKAPPAPPIKVTAAELTADYQANEVAADERWKGKSVAITGVVAGTKKDFMDDIYVILGSGARFETHHVQAFLGKKEKAKAAQLSTGSKATLTCRIDGMIIMSVMAKNCVIGEGAVEDDE